MNTTTKKTTNKAPVGSVWTIEINGTTDTYTVLSMPIPGNDLRKVMVASTGKEDVLGCNWFKRGERIA